MTLLDRTQAPPFRLSSDYSLVPPELFLAGDIKVFAFRGLQQDVVRLELIFDAGKWYEPLLGVSQFTSQMLSKGTRTKNSFQIAEGLDSLGAHLEISPGFDVVTLSLFALRKNLIAAMNILVELLQSPSFDEDELRIMKEIFSQNLRVNNEKTSVVASKEIRKAIFGEAHPYGSSVEEADVKQIQQEDLQKFFQTQFSLQTAFLVGRLSDQEVQSLIGLLSPLVLTTDKYKTDNPAFLRTSQAPPRPKSVQASIRLGKKCLPKSDGPEYFDAAMFNHVLGGFFGSRLMKNIREEKGLTYGIYSSLNHFLHDSFWVIGAEVNQQNAGMAIEEIRNEIRKLKQELISGAELEIARNYFIGSWQSENSTLFSVAEKVKSRHLWALSENYYTHLLTHLQEITPLQIQAAANTYFDDADLYEVQVG